MKIPHTVNNAISISLAKIVSFILIGCGGLFVSQANAEELASLSNELLKQVGDDAFWEAKVKCEGGFNSVVIRQKIKENSWCVGSGKLSCEKTKLKMAEQVCLNIRALTKPVAKPVSRVAASPKPQPTSSAAALKRAEAETAAKARRLARIKAEQEVIKKREADELALVSAINEEQLVLQEARLILDREKLEVEQLELELKSRAREIEQELLSLEN